MIWWPTARGHNSKREGCGEDDPPHAPPTLPDPISLAKYALLLSMVKMMDDSWVPTLMQAGAAGVAALAIIYLHRLLERPRQSPGRIYLFAVFCIVLVSLVIIDRVLKNEPLCGKEARNIHIALNQLNELQGIENVIDNDAEAIRANYASRDVSTEAVRIRGQIEQMQQKRISIHDTIKSNVDSIDRKNC